MEAILNFDLAIFEFVDKFRDIDLLREIMEAITVAGNDGYIFIAFGIVMLFFKKTRKAGLVCLGSLLVMTLLNNELIKPIMERPRPYNLAILPEAAALAKAEYGKDFDWIGFFGKINWNVSPEFAEKWSAGYVWPDIVDKMESKSLSFPSGHTSSAFTFAMAFTLVCKKHASKLATIKVAVFTFIFAILMGISRIYVGVHYPTDVIVAAVVGIIYAVIGYFIFATLYDLVYKAVTKKKA